jgi:hypothetical protein
VTRGAGLAVRILAAVAVSLGAGCHKVPLVAPSGSSLTLVSSTNLLPVNGAANITAVVIQGGESTTGTTTTTTTVTAGVGQPVRNGTTVTFLTTLGRIEPATAETTNGAATVQLIADGRSGVATITAFSGAATKTMTVNVGAAGAAVISVTASPQALPATGGASTIAARVSDQQGNGVIGVPVSFSTSAGTLSPTTATTDDKGVASTTLLTTAAATVTATTGGATATLSGTVAITLSPRTTIAITPPSSAMIGVPASFTVTPGTATILTDVSVDFGDGSVVDLGPLNAAQTFAHLFQATGVRSITVTATDTQGGSTQAKTEVSVSNLAASGTFSPSSSTQPQLGVDVVVFTIGLPTNAQVDHFEWSFGDGQGAETTGNQAQHTYTDSSGTKIVTVLVVPAGGGPAVTVLMQVVVKP